MLKSRPKLADADIESFNTRDDDVIQRAIDAAAHCIDKLGLDKTSVEDIAREAGISRATLYRRFGNREAILTALLQQQARPFVDESIRIMATLDSFVDRLVESTIYAVSEMPRNRFLQAMFKSGLSRSNLDLIRPVYQQLVNVTLLPALQTARACGELRTGLDDVEVSEWLMRDFLLMFADAPLDEQKLRRRLQQFVLPVLLSETPGTVAEGKVAVAGEDSLEARLGRMEQRLTEMQQAIGLLRQDFLDQKSAQRR